MTKKTWTFQLEDGLHKVELEHSYISSKRTIHVDGQLLEDTRGPLLDTGSEHPFRLGRHNCLLRIGTNGLTFSYELLVDGRSVQTEGQVMASPASAHGGEYGPYGGAEEGMRVPEAPASATYWADEQPKARTEEEARRESEKATLAEQVRSGAGWFFWIAALSLVNSILFLMDAGWQFLIGLGITQVIDNITLAWEQETGNSLKLVAIVLDLEVTGLFFGFGLWARQRRNWAFIVGMVLYALDGVIFLVLPLLLEIPPEWINIGFHAFALFFIFGGLRANMKLAQMEEQDRLQGQYAAPLTPRF